MRRLRSNFKVCFFHYVATSVNRVLDELKRSVLELLCSVLLVIVSLIGNTVS